MKKKVRGDRAGNLGDMGPGGRLDTPKRKRPNRERKKGNCIAAAHKVVYCRTNGGGRGKKGEKVALRKKRADTRAVEPKRT